MSKKYKVLLCGCGGMANGWLDVLMKSPQVDMVGFVDIRQESAEAFAIKAGRDKKVAGTNLKKMIAKCAPEIVVDVTIPLAHKPVTMTALKAGCHVLGEKPLSDSMRNARAMVACARETGKIYMVSQNYRWNPQVRAIREAIEAGMIGAVGCVNIDFYIGAHFGGFREEMAHPLLLDMSIHHFDLVRCVTQMNPTHVYAREYNPPGSWYKGDVAATAVFELGEKTLFTYRGSWCAEGADTVWNGLWRIIGEKGTIVWDGTNDPVAHIVSPEPGKFTSPKTESILKSRDNKSDWLSGSWERFIEALESGKDPETVCHDNIKSLAMVFAAVESADKKKRIEVRP